MYILHFSYHYTTIPRGSYIELRLWHIQKCNSIETEESN